jgi:hypothetical protein
VGFAILYSRGAQSKNGTSSVVHAVLRYACRSDHHTSGCSTDIAREVSPTPEPRTRVGVCSMHCPFVTPQDACPCHEKGCPEIA